MSIVFLGPIRALKDCWVIGDKFINEVYYTLPEANQNTLENSKEKLYLYDQLNVKCFSLHPLTKIKEAPAQLVNSLVHALNEKPPDSESKTNVQTPFLPRFIIVVPDWDIVKYVGHYKYGVTIITEKIV